MTAIALIPARGGSKRLPGKNIKELAGHPLLAYTIAAAKQSECFEKVLVSSDDTETLETASRFGADCIRRPDGYSGDTSPDIEWVKHALKVATDFDTFSILRPTSPFRLPETINRAFREWNEANRADEFTGTDGTGYQQERRYTSLRAVELAGQHPGKMWTIKGRELVPFTLQPPQPFHDSQYASLPQVWVQNASLEIAWVQTVELTGTISGPRVMAFETAGREGFDINTLPDWEMAEQMVRNGEWELPDVAV